jgi:hypothetical protein
MRVLESWYFGLCWNLRLINYRVLISWRILVSFRGFFRRSYFCMVKYLSFHNSPFALIYFFNVNDKAIVWHTPLLIRVWVWASLWVFRVVVRCVVEFVDCSCLLLFLSGWLHGSRGGRRFLLCYFGDCKYHYSETKICFGWLLYQFPFQKQNRRLLWTFCRPPPTKNRSEAAN